MAETLDKATVKACIDAIDGYADTYQPCFEEARLALTGVKLVLARLIDCDEADLAEVLNDRK